MNEPRTFENPKGRAAAKAMMLAALDGKEVNGAYLSSPGLCTYEQIVLDGEEGTKTLCCIVGALMTPEQRKRVVGAGLNNDTFNAVADKELVDDLLVTTGLRVEELRDLQRHFDMVSTAVECFPAGEPRRQKALIMVREAIESLPD